MFSTFDFRIRKRDDYPHFGQVIQSWYAPILSSKEQEDGNYSACITIGVTNKLPHSKKEVILLSVFNSIVHNSVDLLKNISCLSKDYLNKTRTVSDSHNRVASVIVFEAEKGNPSKILASVKNDKIFRFYPECFGGRDLEERLHAARPYVGKVLFSYIPGKKVLRPDDDHLMGLLLAYPSTQSYAIASAYAQSILYAAHCRAFDDDDDVVSSDRPSHGFYGE